MTESAARKLLRPKAESAPELGPDLASMLPGRFAALLGQTLGAELGVELAGVSTPRNATLRGWLGKPCPKAVLALGGCASGYCLPDERLARNIVSLRLGVRVGVQPAHRPLSQVDQALCAAVVEALQAVLAQWLKVELPRAAALQTGPLPSPAAGPWRVFLLGVSYAGTPIGTVKLILPCAFIALPPQPATTPSAANPAWALGRAIQAAPVPVQAVLHRQHLDHGGLAKLRAGDVIALPDGCLGALEIALGDGAATAIARARLGAYDGMKVLKLLAAPDARALELVRE